MFSKALHKKANTEEFVSSNKKSIFDEHLQKPGSVVTLNSAPAGLHAFNQSNSENSCTRFELENAGARSLSNNYTAMNNPSLVSVLNNQMDSHHVRQIEILADAYLHCQPNPNETNNLTMKDLTHILSDRELQQTVRRERESLNSTQMLMTNSNVLLDTKTDLNLL